MQRERVVRTRKAVEPAPLLRTPSRRAHSHDSEEEAAAEQPRAAATLQRQLRAVPSAAAVGSSATPQRTPGRPAAAPALVTQGSVRRVLPAAVTRAAAAQPAPSSSRAAGRPAAAPAPRAHLTRVASNASNGSAVDSVADEAELDFSTGGSLAVFSDSMAGGGGGDMGAPDGEGVGGGGGGGSPFTHSPCGASLVYGVSSEEVNRGSSATTNGPLAARLVTARQGGQGRARAAREAEEEDGGFGFGRGYGHEEEEEEEEVAEEERSGGRQLLYGHIAGLRPRAVVAAPPAPPPVPAPALRPRASHADLRRAPSSAAVIAPRSGWESDGDTASGASAVEDLRRARFGREVGRAPAPASVSSSSLSGGSSAADPVQVVVKRGGMGQRAASARALLAAPVHPPPAPTSASRSRPPRYSAVREEAEEEEEEEPVMQPEEEEEEEEEEVEQLGEGAEEEEEAQARPLLPSPPPRSSPPPRTSPASSAGTGEPMAEGGGGRGSPPTPPPAAPRLSLSPAALAAVTGVAREGTREASPSPSARPRPYFLRDGPRIPTPYRPSASLNDNDFDVVIVVHVPERDVAQERKLKRADAEAEARAYAAAVAVAAGAVRGRGRAGVGSDGLEVTVPLDITLSGPVNEWAEVRAAEREQSGPGGSLVHTATGLSAAESSFTLAHGLGEEEGSRAGRGRRSGPKTDSASDTDSASGSEGEEEGGRRRTRGGRVWGAVEAVAAAARASLGGRSRSNAPPSARKRARGGEEDVTTVLPRSPSAPPGKGRGGGGLLSPSRLAALGLSPSPASPSPPPDASRPHKCQEILKALKRARLSATRLRSLSKSTWLIGIKAPEWRLELEAEKLRLRMRRKDGGWSKFKRRYRDAFVAAIPEEGGEDSEGEGGNPSAPGGPPPRPSGASATLFHSSDRQTLVDHILRSSTMEGGADLGVGSPLGAYVTDMFPVHMYARLLELRSDWLALWRPEASRPEQDRIGSVRKEWYAPPAMLPLGGGGARPGAVAESLPEGGPPRSGGGGSGSSAPSFLCCLPARFRCSSRSPAVQTLLALPPVRLAYTVGVLAAKGGRSVARTWAHLMSQPLDRIAAYFGESIAFYFAWMEFYTQWLLAPAAVGTLLFLGQLYWGAIDIAYVPLFSLAMALWSILFLEFWKRRNSELAQRWGVLHYEDEEAVRPAFVGEWKQDAGSGEVVRVYPAWRRALTYAVTVPVTLAYVAGVVLLLIGVYSTRDRVVVGYETAALITALRSSVLANSTVSAAIEAGNVTLPPVPSVDVVALMGETWSGLGWGMWASLSPTSTLDEVRNPFGLGSYGLDKAQAVAVVSALAQAGITLTVSVDGATITPSGVVATAGLPSASNPGLSLSVSDLSRGIDLGHFRAYFESRGDWRWWAAMTLPPVLLGLFMPLVDAVFAQLALAFNDSENHATESQYRNHRIAKVFFFRFTVSFISLFYYAFSPQHSLVQLSVQVATFCLVGQMWNNALEVLLPRMVLAWRECRFRRRLKHAEESGLTEGRHGRKLVRHATAQAWREYRMPLYDPFDDYAELLIQFGYVSFFSWAFPLAPACALVNNILEMRGDAYKLCYATRRPVAHKAGGIGVWYNVLVAMSLLAVLTNCAHLAIGSKSFDVYFPGWSAAQKMLVVFIFEHGVLALRMLLPYAIASTPASVKWRLNRERVATADLHAKREEREERAGKAGAP